MSRSEDDAILHCVEGDLSEGECKATRELTDDLRALVEAARSAGETHAPEALHAAARADVLECLQAARTGPVTERRPRSAAAWAGRLRRRRVLGYAVAAALAAVVWAGSGDSVADVVAAVRKQVRILVLGRDGEVLQDSMGEVQVTVDTLYLPEELGERGALAPDRPADRDRPIHEETAARWPGGIVVSPVLPSPVDSIDRARAHGQGDTLVVGGTAGTPVAMDTVRAATWGQLKGGARPHSSSGTSR